MALFLLTTSAFEPDLRRVRKPGKNLGKREAVVDSLQDGTRLPARWHPHPLRGKWAGHWDCRVEPDWSLLYKITERELILVRTGSHAELF